MNRNNNFYLFTFFPLQFVSIWVSKGGEISSFSWLDFVIALLNLCCGVCMCVLKYYSKIHFDSDNVSSSCLNV